MWVTGEPTILSRGLLVSPDGVILDRIRPWFDAVEGPFRRAWLLADRNLRIDLVDRRFHFGPLFQEAIREANTSGRKARVGGPAQRILKPCSFAKLFALASKLQNVSQSSKRADAT